MNLLTNTLSVDTPEYKLALVIHRHNAILARRSREDCGQEELVPPVDNSPVKWKHPKNVEVVKLFIRSLQP